MLSHVMFPYWYFAGSFKNLVFQIGQGIITNHLKGHINHHELRLAGNCSSARKLTQSASFYAMTIVMITQRESEK